MANLKLQFSLVEEVKGNDFADAILELFLLNLKLCNSWQILPPIEGITKFGGRRMEQN